LKGPQTHKEDNDRYLYFEDPDGNMIELVASTLEGGAETAIPARVVHPVITGPAKHVSLRS